MKIPPGSFDSDCRIVITKNGQERHVTLDELLAVLLAGDNAFTGEIDLSGVTDFRANFLPGYIHGLTLSNGSDATNDIDIAVGAASSDDTSPWLMTLSSAITKRLDASWAVGSGNGGRMSAAGIANTTYHVWLIQRSDTGVVDAGFDVSATAPTMPANYDRKRRIGSIVRSGGTILAFFQRGDVFTYLEPILDYNTTNPGTGGIVQAISVPLGIIVESLGDVAVLSSSTSSIFIVNVNATASTSVVPSATGAYTLTLNTLSTAGTYRAASYSRVFTNTSAEIRLRLSASDANTTLRFLTRGWVDTRGR